MFPIRRPCTDAVRSGISVLWCSPHSPSPATGWLLGRIILRPAPRALHSSFSDNRLGNASPSSPPTLTAVLRASGGVSCYSAAAAAAALPAASSSSSTAPYPPHVAVEEEEEWRREFAAASPQGKVKEQATPSAQERPLKQQRKEGGSATGDPTDEKPTSDQMRKTYNILQKSLERVFTHPMDYTVYHPDILFIDNIRHIRTEGIAKYIQQVSILKIVGHLKFAYVRFDILNMSLDEEAARITVRWRIKGLSGLRVMLKFWKYKLWKWQEIMNFQETWHDGISYFDLGPGAKIVRHVADKMMEDKDPSLDEKSTASGRSLPFAAKLGGALGAIPAAASSLNYQQHNASSPASTSSESKGGGGGASK